MKRKFINNQIVYFQRVAILLGLLILVNPAFSQSRITGKIMDKATGELLVGVTVGIKGTTNATSSDMDGKYNLKVDPGTYTIFMRYISYKGKEIAGVVVKPGEVVYLDMVLEENSTSIQEVEVVAEAKKESTAGINIERRNAVTVSDGVSGEQFRKTPDRNVSDVLKRVAGTSIQDNKFAIIRGMNDRYNAAYMNGAPLPSTESDRKAFAFNMIPSNLIDNLIIYKAPAPDLSGDFAGGIIMINTKNIPESKTSVFNFSTGINTITTFQPFYHFRNSKTDILGFDNGTRKMPENENFREGLQKSEYVNITKKFNNDWNIYKGTALPNSNLSYTWGRSFKHHLNSFGTLASFTYSNANRFSSVQQRKYRYDDNNLDQDYTDKQYTNTVNLGALLNFSYHLKKKTMVSVKNLFNLNTDDVTTMREGLISGENAMYSRSYSNIYSQNRIFSTQITGEHQLLENKRKFSWVLNAGSIFRSMPDYRIASYAGEGENPESYSLLVNNNLFSTSSGRFYSNMSEMIFSGTFNYTSKFKVGEIKNEFKTGYFTQLRKREFKSRYFTYYGPWGITGTPQSNLSESNVSTDGVFMVEQSSPARDNYDADARLHAGYLMMDSRLPYNIRLVYGVRYENYHQVIHTANGSNLPMVIDSVYSDLLPSVNMTWGMNEKTNLRFSAGKTINRPEFREMAMFPFYNFNLNSNIAGNPGLQPARIWNYDVRYEFFPKPNEVMSVGFFYKKINNPIELAIDVNQVSLRTFGYDNQKSANNYGLELEFRKSLKWLAELTGYKQAENFVVFTNLALIHSSIKFKENSAMLNKRPLQGQSPYVVNAGLQYTHPQNLLGINISYNKIGRRIAFAGGPRIAKFGLDIYENPRDVLDVQLTKTIKNWDLKLTIGDLLAQDLVFYQDINNDKKYNSQDNTIFRYKMGSTATLAFAYKFK